MGWRRKTPFFGGGRDPFAETKKIKKEKSEQRGEIRGQGEGVRGAREHLIADFGLFRGFRAKGRPGGGRGGGGLGELIRGNRA
jgi:hypothetical protein